MDVAATGATTTAGRTTCVEARTPLFKTLTKAARPNLAAYGNFYEVVTNRLSAISWMR